MKPAVATVVCLVLCSAASTASGDAFKSSKDCVSGKRVVDGQGRTGTVVKLANDELCQVRIDESGKDVFFIFWMLSESGKSAPPKATAGLVNGTYECFANGRYTFMDMEVTSPTTYRTDGGPGKFHVEAGNKLVFENGPFANTQAKVDRGPSILISTDGSFYGTSCELKK